MKAGRAALAAGLLTLGCAQVREITGGERDAEGPKLVEAIPANGTTRFTGDRFLLRFDERIQIERTRTGLMVSPPMDPPPSLRLVGARELEVRLHAPLLPGTTYSFAIGEAVKDLTEGNPASGLEFAISTGDHLDSLRLHGTLIDAFTQAAQEQVLVMLLEEGDTASFTSGRPAFITRTDSGGRFVLQHLPRRAFNLVALRDLNGNYRYDLPREEIAFNEASLTPSAFTDSTARPLQLRLFKAPSASQGIREATVTADRAWRFVLAKPAQTIAVRDIAREGGSLTWQPEWGVARDTVLLWPSDTTTLTEGRFAIATEAGVLDTLRYRPAQTMPFHVTAEAVSEQVDGNLHVRLTATRPLSAIDTALVRLRADSVTIPFALVRDSTNARVVVLRAALAPGRGAQLTLLPKALRDVYAGANDTLRLGVGVSAASALGILRVTLDAEQLAGSMLLLELLDAQGRTVRTEAGAMHGTTVTWEGLRPGNHTLRLTQDANSNGRWDTGEWHTGLQPERIWLHPEPVNVRAAWDLGIEWRILQE